MRHDLHEALGDQYLALGMLFGNGYFFSRCWHEETVREFQVGPAGKEHLEYCFAGRRLGLYRTARLPAASQARYRPFVGNLYADDVTTENPAAPRIERPLANFEFVESWPRTAAAGYPGTGSAPPAWEPA